MTETNQSLSSLFNTMADLLTVSDRSATGSTANPHRVRAYRKAAVTIAALPEDIRTVASRGDLQQLPGIGRELSAKIEEFLRTGTMRAYEELKRPLPPEVRGWCTLPGFSEVLVQQLYHRLGIRTAQDLEMLLRSHLLRTLPGVSISEQTVLDALRREAAPTGAPTAGSAE